MTIDTQSLEVRNNAEKNRYEITLGDKVALIQYRFRKERLVLIHTEVPDEFEGQGIASKLAKFALEDARANGHPVKPLCPFVASYIDDHPEYQDLVVD